PLSGLRLGLPLGPLLQALDPTVSARFSTASEMLTKAGARLSDENISLFDEIARVQAKASFSSVESYAVHRQWLTTRTADYDPNVLSRIQQGANVSAAEYIVMQRDRAALVRAMDARLTDLDALVLPTVPIVSPTLTEVTPPDVFAQKNLLLIRNPAAM